MRNDALQDEEFHDKRCDVYRSGRRTVQSAQARMSERTVFVQTGLLCSGSKVLEFQGGEPL